MILLRSVYYSVRVSAPRIIQRSPDNVTVTVSMDRELQSRLHARARALRLSVSALVRLMIAADLEGQSALRPNPHPFSTAQPPPSQLNEA